MAVRRCAETIWVQHIWDAIHLNHAQRQMADLTRISKYLQRLHECTQTEAEFHIKQALNDGLILSLQKVTVKGSKLGTQVESYKVPINEQSSAVRNGLDWYCFDCHLPGDVVACKTCFRVYHESCDKIRRAVPKVDLSKQKTPSRNNSPDINDESQGVAQDESIMNTLGESLSFMVNNVEKQLEKMEESDSANEDNSKSGTEENETACSDELTCVNTNGAKDEAAVFSSNDKIIYDENRCSVCNACKVEPGIDVQKEELNYLLNFVYSRICSWLPKNITDKMSEDEHKTEWDTEADRKWRAQQLFYLPIDMNIIKNKLDAQEYISLGQFKADVLTIQHNVFIYHGAESQEVGAAEYMLKDCCYDISEIQNCADCYKHSNEKLHNHWFCLPCRNPHKLVWAKQKGYPYWPAKVIKETNDTSDVRFFGGKYERSVLHNSYIKPISVDKNNFQIKKSSAFNKAVQELVLHQKMLENPSAISKHANKRKSTSKPNKSVLKVLKTDHTNNQNESKSLDVYNFDECSLILDSNEPANLLRNKKPSTPPTKAKIQSPDHSSQPQTKNESPPPKNNFDDSSFMLPSDQEVNQNDCEELHKGCDGGNEEVSSSTEQIRDVSDAVMPQTDRQYSESVEKTRRKLEQCRDRQQLIKVALESMQAEIDKINSDRDDYIKKMFEAHNNQISETKKKQWCYNCEQDAIYHCCWNTAYCSPTCQQQHWQAEHKKVCRRKR